MGFNLVIERLFISGAAALAGGYRVDEVSISQSRGFSFQARNARKEEQCTNLVSISQSRCFSYQDLYPQAVDIYPTLWFQSRNRDAFHIRGPARPRASPFLRFNLAIEMLFISGTLFSTYRIGSTNRFNLAIEMLFISGEYAINTRSEQHCCFNLAIEMLFISGFPLPLTLPAFISVSISQSRCFSYQVRAR